MGTLYLIATPIGNLEDISFRALKTFFSVDYLLCEDTRRTGILLSPLEKRFSEFLKNPQRPQLLSYYEEVEEKKIPLVLGLLAQDYHCALVSDAGTPLISDPGFKLVREALKRGVKVVSLPGPSAFLVALTSSGLPSDKFFFLGYPPVKASRRLSFFRNLAEISPKFSFSPVLIFYESPHRLGKTLLSLREVFGEREIVLARELTKLYEEIWRGKISEALQTFSSPRGEFVILFPL